MACAVALGATVAGLDASPGMVAYAHNRLRDADIRHGDLQVLPFDDDSFDAVLAANSVQFTPDPVLALAEIRRVCVPGGRVTVATWGEREKCEFRFAMEANANVFAEPPRGMDPFALSSAGALEALVEQGGLTVIGGESVHATFVFADADEAYRGNCSSAMGERAARAVGEDALRAAMNVVYQRFRQPDGRIVFDNCFRFVVATP